MSHEELIARYTDLDDQRRMIEDEQRAIKDKLIDLGIGSHEIAGVKVTITSPPRRFNLERGFDMLSAEQRRLATSPDAKKVKAFLPPVLLDECMDAGTGNPVVRIS